jgi:hypothetical protein
MQQYSSPSEEYELPIYSSFKPITSNSLNGGTDYENRINSYTYKQRMINNQKQQQQQQKQFHQQLDPQTLIPFQNSQQQNNFIKQQQLHLQRLRAIAEHQQKHNDLNEDDEEDVSGSSSSKRIYKFLYINYLFYLSLFYIFL